jgi:hypothetical protein
MLLLCISARFDVLDVSGSVRISQPEDRVCWESKKGESSRVSGWRKKETGLTGD